MLMPISKERKIWVDQRIAILDMMVRELTARQSRYLSNPRFASYHSRVMDNLLAEQLQLNIERNTLVAFFEEQELKKAAESNNGKTVV